MKLRTMRAEANIDLETYMERAPDPLKNRVRYEWHLERYRFAAAHFQGQEKIADLGCGWGFGTEFLARSGGQVCGFDINPSIVEHASRRFRQSDVRFEVHDIMDGPLPGGAYDLICMFEVIEHLEDPGLGLASIRASLQQGGVLLLSTPNALAIKKGSHPYHSTEFTPKSFESVLRSHFKSVTMFSQGTSEDIQEPRTSAATKTIIELVRSAQALSAGRFILGSIREQIGNRISESAQQNVDRQDLIRITEGQSESATWLLAACSA